MTAWLFWLLISGSLVAAEIFTLSFYLLLAGIGALVASGVAATGYDSAAQLIAATGVTLIGWAALQKYNPKHQHPDSRTNPALNMDIGNTVRINSIDANGKISVILRGANWEARIEDGSEPDTTVGYIITKLDGSILILTKKI